MTIEDLKQKIDVLPNNTRQSLLDAIALQAAYLVSHCKPLPDYNDREYINTLKSVIDSAEFFTVENGNIVAKRID